MEYVDVEKHFFFYDWSDHNKNLSEREKPFNDRNLYQDNYDLLIEEAGFEYDWFLPYQKK